jgi:Protein of unknown function (DUF3306)
MAERDETFLARWSRRKQAARAAEREQEPQHSAPERPTRAADANAPERPDAAVRTPALPDPSTLDASSDFSVFLGKDVPIETQRAALRRLWRLDPIYNRMDGLDDYCADFTDQATVVKGLRTAYRVGRGILERTSEPEAPPVEAPPAQRPSDEAQRIAASDDPTLPPPDSPAQQPNPFAQQKQHEAPARTPAKRRTRPLPKRG